MVLAKAKAEKFKLDPRTSLIAIAAVGLPTITAASWYELAIASVVPLSLYFLSGKTSRAVKYTVLYVLALLVDRVVVDRLHGIVAILVVMLSGIICRLMPVLLMGAFVLSTTTVSEFIAASERMHVPKQIVIPFSVMFRFIPTINEESSAIADAMRMRGIALGRTRGGPIALLEYRLVPLIISIVKIGEELSAAALTRGLGAPVKRTNICRIGFRAHDVVYIAISCALLVMFFIL